MRGGASSGDPYFVARDQVAAKIAAVQAKHAQLNAAIDKARTLTDRDVKELKPVVARDLETAKGQLRDLKRTVDYVEKDRASFPHIDDAELRDRKAFLNAQKKILNAIVADTEGDKLAAKLEKETAAKRDSYRKGDLGAKSNAEADNTEFIHDQRSNRMAHIARQDQDLEELGEHVDRVGMHAETINEELRDQGRMLDDLNEDIVTTHESMGMVMGAMAKILKTKDRAQIWLIVTLVVILVILVFLVVYT
ncbi:soluble NSF attachment protein receptor [Tribonema minus]|uniref:Soluble NSF attachment protein receptor n=1 Tax=Tribonema minus TaxID=303371 RepID=A0A836CAK7_9STRA|nr:soluble NSF attachment protein receptor [Tribonema minus]